MYSLHFINIYLYLVFANQMLLVSHMDVHDKANSHAQAILKSISPEKQKSPVVQGITNKEQPGTTLISITTPKVPTPESLMSNVSVNSNMRPKVSNIKSSRARMLSKTPVKNEIPEGLRVMCCTCNQLFNSQPELYNHKCTANSGGITMVATTNGGADRSKMAGSLTATLIPSSAESQQMAISQSDQDKILLSMQLAQSGDQQVVVEIPASLQEALAQQIANTNSVNHSQATAALAIQPAPIKQNKQSFIRKRRKPSAKLQAIAPQPNIVVSTSGDQLILSTDSNSHVDSAAVPCDGVQTFVLQQADGQIVQINLPSGVDVNDFINGLSSESLVTGADTQGAAVVTDYQQQIPLAIDSEAQQAANLLMDNASLSADQHSGQADGVVTNGQNQVLAQATVQNPDGSEQVVYYSIPVNEDGTMAFDPNQMDADTLATLLASSSGASDSPYVINTA